VWVGCSHEDHSDSDAVRVRGVDDFFRIGGRGAVVRSRVGGTRGQRHE
jgi:hypothetical protein